MQKDRYVLLIDGDNVNWSYLDPFVEHIKANYGEIKEIHLFGKLESSYLSDWKQMYDSYKGITISYNVGEHKKNDTDIRMIHVAWKLYYGAGVRKFVIMSSDSDMAVVIHDLKSEAEVILGYNRNKVSSKYLQSLNEQGITHIDMDAVRGKLSKNSISDIINCVAKSYLQFKLGKEFFSYDTIIDWIVDRYPEMAGITKEQLIPLLVGYSLSFESDGVKLTQSE